LKQRKIYMRLPCFKDIKKLSDQIVEKYNPEKIILFGSYAYGSPTEDSDVDLFVLMPFEGRSVYKSVEIKAYTRTRFPVDLIIRNPEDTQRRYEEFDPLVREAIDRGKVLYEQDS